MAPGKRESRYRKSLAKGSLALQTGQEGTAIWLRGTWPANLRLRDQEVAALFKEAEGKALETTVENGS